MKITYSMITVMDLLLDAESHASSDFFCNKIEKGGFHNVVEHKTINGFPCGLLSLLKNGYNEMQISKTLPHQISIKSVKRFVGYM
jgi:hypothetical protein